MKLGREHLWTVTLAFIAGAPLLICQKKRSPPLSAVLWALGLDLVWRQSQCVAKGGPELRILLPLPSEGAACTITPYLDTLIWLNPGRNKKLICVVVNTGNYEGIPIFILPAFLKLVLFTKIVADHVKTFGLVSVFPSFRNNTSTHLSLGRSE